MTVYFVTGGTGALGSALVPMLLAHPDAKVYMLIRAKDDVALAGRIHKLFDFWRLESQESDFRDRVVGLRGDASAPRFGLSDGDYLQLSRHVTHVVHAAGAVKLNLPLAEARRSAVSSAREALTLAEQCANSGQLQKVELVSTVGVGGKLGRVPEDWITTRRDFHNTYEQAKAEAEDTARERIDAGLPITLHRPSMVVGDSKRGRIIHYQVFYHLCEFLSGARTFGLSPPLGDVRLDIVPVDYVARVIAWSAQQPGTIGKILHECSGPQDAVPLTGLRECVRKRFEEKGRRLPAVIPLSSGMFNRLLSWAKPFAGERNRRALATLPVFLEYLASPVVFENDKTRMLLEQAGQEGAPAVSAYLDTVLRAYLDR